MVLKRQLITLFILLLFAPLATSLADTPAVPPVTATAGGAQVTEPGIPGLSELGPRVSMLADFVEKSESRLLVLAELKALEETLTALRTKREELREKVALLGSPNDWYVDRLNQFINQFTQLKLGLEDLQKKLTGRQQEVEEIRAKSLAEDAFFKQWGEDLRAQKVAVPEKTVNQVKSLLKRAETTENKTSRAILNVQEHTSALQQEVIAELDLYTDALAALRKATFRKNSHSFFAPEFYALFNAQLRDEFVQGWRSALTLDWGYLLRYSWVFALLLAGTYGIGYAIRRFAPPINEYKEWSFVLSHPFAAGTFIALILASNLFTAPPTQLSFGLMTAGIIAGAILAADLVENLRQARMLYLAALVLILTTGFRLIALPQPLFRIYIALLALATLPLLLNQIRTSLRKRGRKAGRFFRSLLRLTMLVLLVSLLTQIAGYMNFSAWLLQATFETGMVLLFAHMILRLSRGGIIFILRHPSLSRHKFIRSFGRGLTLRCERVLQLLVSIYCFFYLMTLWRVFASSQEAWTYLSSLAFSVGDVTISLKMLLLALLTLYLTFQLSWLLQSLLEARFFYRKSVDRGVRDAVKKLMHYGVVTFGFLTVLSTLGMSLQNFVVVLGAFGVGIGFGLQDIVNNFLSGLILLFERPVKVGDFIVVNEEWGHIRKIGLRSTVVETIDHAEIIVPNSQLISEKVTNWTLSSRVARLVVPVGVAYGSDVPLVMRILTDIAVNHPEAVTEPEPSILFMNFGDSSLNFEIRVFVAEISSRFRIRSEILQQIDARFRENGVEIPFPQRDLHLRSVDARVAHQIRGEQPEGKI